MYADEVKCAEVVLICLYSLVRLCGQWCYRVALACGRVYRGCIGRVYIESWTRERRLKYICESCVLMCVFYRKWRGGRDRERASPS